MYNVCHPPQLCSAPSFFAPVHLNHWHQIQRLTTRLVQGFRRLPYEERLRRLGLHSLRRRRLRGDLIVVYKMFSGGLGLDPSLIVIPPVRPGLRGHPFKVLQSPSRRLLFNTSRKILEQAPHSYCNHPSVNSFIRQLDSVWEELFAEVP